MQLSYFSEFPSCVADTNKATEIEVSPSKQSKKPHGTLPIVSHINPAALCFPSMCLILDCRKYFHRSLSRMKSQDRILQDPKYLFFCERKKTPNNSSNKQNEQENSNQPKNTQTKNLAGQNLRALVAVKLNLLLVYSNLHQPLLFLSSSLGITASVDLHVWKHGTVLATPVHHVAATVGGLEEEEACNKHALNLLEIWKKTFGELSAHIARTSDCSKDCVKVGIPNNNSIL